MMLEVIEHLADIPHMLREIARVMRPGARRDRHHAQSPERQRRESTTC